MQVDFSAPNQGLELQINRGTSNQGGDLGRDLDPILQAQEDSYQIGLIMSTDGHMPTNSYQEGTSEPSTRQITKTTQSLQQTVEGLARQYQSVARDIEELKKGKSSAIMEQRVGDNLGGFNLPHHQRPFDNVCTYGYHDMPAQNSHPFQEVGYQGRAQHRGDYGDNPNVGQAYHGGYYGNQQGDKAFDKIKWKVPDFKGESDPNERVWPLNVGFMRLRSSYVFHWSVEATKSSVEFFNQKRCSCEELDPIQ
ncbi:hypothetical protein M9H77_12788 [Catharanthus roseus]|uniref:Uncharacterized protein n=1 Tax=Catharanthus roseus TaxID=4058 RepID=A0ACC0BIB1_CATRO|nr:hypothetical protein M9H77_12788 [Catharanthus roseus]